MQHLEHVLERQRLEVQPVGGVVVGRHGLRVAVDHDGLVAVLAQRERGVNAAVVELDALPDAVGTAAEDRDLAPRGRLRLALLLVGRVEVGGGGGELGGAGVDPLEDRSDAERVAVRAQVVLADADEAGEPRVGEAAALERAQARGVERGEALRGDGLLLLHQLLDLREEPGVDVRQLLHPLEGPARAQRVGDVQQAVRARHAQLLREAGHGDVVERLPDGRRRIDRREAVEAGLEPAQRLLQRLLEGAADGHHLAHRLHLRGQVRVGGRELLEGEARALGDDVVDARLEARRGGATGDVVAQLV